MKDSSDPGDRRKRFARRLVPMLCSCLVLVGCGGDAPSDERGPAVGSVEDPPVWFASQAEDRGIAFTLETELDPAYWCPEITVGGGAAFDYDGDGRLDLYLIQATGPGGNRLFRNLGAARFEDVTESAGVGHEGYGSGVATGDYDGDGDLDLFVSNLGPDVLFRNDGDGTFTDVTASSGLGDPGWGVGSTFFDMDADGDLDLFVARYIDWSPDREKTCRNTRGGPEYCHPISFEAPSHDLLYRNDEGRFVDISMESGVAGEVGNGLGVVAADFDGDGRPDVFVANDKNPDRLWINQGGGVFEESAFRLGCDRDMTGIAKAGMGVSVADVDDDGDLDLIVCNFSKETDSFYLNEGGRFVDATSRVGIGTPSRRFTRWGLGFVDFDNDARLDYFAANGAVAADLEAPEGTDPYAERNLLLKGRSDRLGFTEVDPPGGVRGLEPRVSRGAIFGDFDDDGGIDVVVVNIGTPTRLLRNVVPDRGHWMLVDVRDDAGAAAIGARVVADLGDRRLMRMVHTDSSYLAARDPRVHLGLGDRAVLPALEVTWPDGRSVRLDEVDADRVIRVDPPAPGAG